MRRKRRILNELTSRTEITLIRDRQVAMDEVHTYTKSVCPLSSGVSQSVFMLLHREMTTLLSPLTDSIAVDHQDVSLTAFEWLLLPNTMCLWGVCSSETVEIVDLELLSRLPAVMSG